MNDEWTSFFAKQDTSASLDVDVFGKKFHARHLNHDEFQKVEVMVDTQSLDCDFWVGLVLMHNNHMFVVLRDVDCKYELIALDYISEVS